jgi:hypothetical protein
MYDSPSIGPDTPSRAACPVGGAPKYGEPRNEALHHHRGWGAPSPHLLRSEKESDSELNTLMGAEESQKMVIENEHIAEKLSAIYCLQEITKYSNPQFIEFFNDCFNELKNQSLFPHTNVRKESYLAMALMLAYYHDYCVLNLAKVSDAQKETIIKGDLKSILFGKFRKPRIIFSFV